eukprot:TRINITY_DN44768_c0_g1_i1.p1 TRINITY_DN44768_c0_g1~~TRINITY_DN44768_c0_g1_i1.p1  ORF type:complete len:280 (+),score=40.19 TRINITY_DN44768_c0_g1_i1:30-842(+)
MDLATHEGFPTLSFNVAGHVVKVPSCSAELRLGCEDVTGFELWQPATTAACRELIVDGGVRVRGKRVLELGCGLGTLGIFCAKLGASHVLLTDREPSVLSLARKSAETNNVADRCDFAVFDFAAGSPPWTDEVFDLVVASDILFLDRLAEQLAKALDQLSCGGKSTSGSKVKRPLDCILGHELRRAVFRGPDGQPQMEDTDSAFEAFRRVAGPRMVTSTIHGDGERTAATVVESVGIRLEWIPGPDANAAAKHEVEDDVNLGNNKRQRIV